MAWTAFAVHAMFKSEQRKHTKYAPGFLCQQNYAKKKVKIQLVWRNHDISRNKTCWKAKIASDPSTSSHHHNQVERWKYLTNVDWKWWFIDTRKRVSLYFFSELLYGKNLIYDFWQIRFENLPFSLTFLWLKILGQVMLRVHHHYLFAIIVNISC